MVHGKGECLPKLLKNRFKYLFGAEIVVFTCISEDFRRFLKYLKMNISETKGVMNFKQQPKGVFLHIKSKYKKKKIGMMDLSRCISKL